MSDHAQRAARNLTALRAKKPLIHNITNFVVMNYTNEQSLVLSSLCFEWVASGITPLVSVTYASGVGALALFVPAPLQGPADPSRVPNPVKSAWFLLWTQELVSWSKELVHPMVLLLVAFAAVQADPLVATVGTLVVYGIAGELDGVEGARDHERPEELDGHGDAEGDPRERLVDGPVHRHEAHPEAYGDPPVGRLHRARTAGHREPGNHCPRHAGTGRGSNGVHPLSWRIR